MAERTSAMGEMEFVLKVKEAARAANPSADPATPMPAAQLERIRVKHGRAVANLVEFPHWPLTREMV